MNEAGENFRVETVYNFVKELLVDYVNLINEHLSSIVSPLELIVGTVFLTIFAVQFYEFLFSHDEDLFTRFKNSTFRLIRRLPIVQRQIIKAQEKTLKLIRTDLAKSVQGHRFFVNLPEKGLTKLQILTKLDDYRRYETVEYKLGHVSGCVYKSTRTELSEIYHRIFDLFGDSNPLHADVFPDIRTMEAEVVRCVAQMFHGDENVCGTMTSGGTESLLMACKTYRDLAYSKGINRPEIVMPITAHPAFLKACTYFRIKMIRIPLDPSTCEVDLKKIRRAITKNTCLLVASAPNFPHGVIDPIVKMSKIATEFNIPLHVDACLGGFLIAFMDQAGYSLEPFDFRLPAVTSISCDTHKYGFAPKGSSVILYRNRELRSHQFYAVADWPGGIYASPTVAGSRSGYSIALCWATLMFHGFNGYVDETKKIIEVARSIAQGWSEIPGLYLLHQPDVSIVAVSSKLFNIYYLFDALHEKGWHLIGLQNPAGIHIAVTQIHTQAGVVEKLLDDTRQSVAEIVKSGKKDDTLTAVIYGTNQKIPDKSLICDITKLCIEQWYETNLTSP